MTKRRHNADKPAPPRRGAVPRKSKGRGRPARTASTNRAGAAKTNGPPVKVRMYRQGLGDCFLLTFGAGDAARHMLIDCGTLGASTTPANTLAKVVKDIRDTTGDHLTIIVATHEHKDHVSGFRSQKDEFKQMTIDHVWLAWTENPHDAVAKSIAVYKQDLAMALGATVRSIVGDAPSTGASGDSHVHVDVEGTRPHSRATVELAMAARDILGFAGDPDMLGADKFAETIDEAMNFIRDELKVRPKYHKPGQPPIELQEIPGFRFYVLGPPRNRDALADLGDHGSSHLYGLQMAAVAHAAADDPLPASLKGECEMEMPFDQRFRLPLDGIADQFPDYENDDWRKVDDDWVHAVAEFALQLDSLTNNTSLALAIERVSDGRVLLFPADAQQGNWLSWHNPDLKWTVQDAKGESRTVTAADLLARTVFYKVGHHGSHNATAKDSGLELMQREDELTAFIPVDRAVALGRNPKGSWKMPARPLYRRLLEKCKGRVARSDITWASNATEADKAETESEFIGMALPKEWNNWKKSQQNAKHVTFQDLYVEYLLE